MTKAGKTILKGARESRDHARNKKKDDIPCFMRRWVGDKRVVEYRKMGETLVKVTEEGELFVASSDKPYRSKTTRTSTRKTTGTRKKKKA